MDQRADRRIDRDRAGEDQRCRAAGVSCRQVAATQATKLTKVPIGEVEVVDRR